MPDENYEQQKLADQRALKLLTWLMFNAHTRRWTPLDGNSGYCTSILSMNLKVYRDGGLSIWDVRNRQYILESRVKTSICEAIDNLTKQQAAELAESRLNEFFRTMGVK